MTATLYGATVPSVGCMRPLNVLRDLPAIADLIELCFSSTLDPEGRSYIEQMRRSGRDSGFLNWAPRVLESVSLPLTGFVWENRGKVVGNVSLIPFSLQGQKIYLIANVATHPDFRRQGIARQLTAAAMQRAREKHARSIWLHVRDDNEAAIRLYSELGFVERTRRTTWNMASGTSRAGIPPANIQILPSVARDWPAQSAWLARSYPTNLDWYRTQNWSIFKPGIINALYRLMTDVNILQWSAYRAGKLQGVLSCQRTTGRSDQLWAALPAEPEADIVTALLLHAQRFLSHSRSLIFDYPSGPIEEAIRSAGLTSQRTLAWMEAAGSATF